MRFSVLFKLNKRVLLLHKVILGYQICSSLLNSLELSRIFCIVIELFEMFLSFLYEILWLIQGRLINWVERFQLGKFRGFDENLEIRILQLTCFAVIGEEVNSGEVVLSNALDKALQLYDFQLHNVDSSQNRREHSFLRSYWCYHCIL